MYYLMNKNEKIAKFSVDELSELIQIEEQYITLPEWYGDLRTFIRIDEHRNIGKILKNCWR